MTEATNDADPGRRRRLSGEQRREQILAGCIRVLAEHGYEAASLEKIAAEAGVSKGLVSHYFTDRDTLMLAVITTGLTRLRARIAADIDLTQPVPGILTAAIHRAAQLTTTHPDELKAAAQVVPNLRGPDGTPRVDSSIYDESYRAQEQLFLRGQQEGTLRPFDVHVMALTYQGAIDTMLDYLTSHPEMDPDDYADNLSDLITAATTLHAMAHSPKGATR